MGEYETMLIKLPLAFCLISVYNYCYTKTCKECKYYKEVFMGCKCTLDPCKCITIVNEFCSDNLLCEGCNLEHDYNCDAKDTIKKITNLKQKREFE